MNHAISVRDLIQRTEKQFELAGLHFGHGTDNALDESFYLVMAAAGLDFDCSEEKLDEPIQQDVLNHIERLIELRVNQRIPVAYLVKEAWFAGHKYYVDERVLIPRSPLAELITSQFMPWLSFNNVNSILDIGTGSACIACACAYAFRHAQVDAVDVDVDAIEVANKNVSSHKLEERVSIIQSNLFEKLKDKKYDLIVSNPPYVGNDEMQSLPQEYLHEPGHALEASDNGLELVDKILKHASDHMNDNGVLVVEVGNSMDVLIERYPAIPFTWLEFEGGGHGVFLLNKSDLGK
ncbi:MAG: 50S ribosomal protein L3 glutamine methyltransferase [marine bacterium B5-7]|nr:MAG: 50S ribosomal protein L3 glutamine methyltransferase [marine bacterium B5-7]